MSRRPRIAVTMTFGLIAGSLAITWIRSHSRAEMISATTQKCLYQIGYGQGKIAIGVDYTQGSFAPFHFDLLSAAIAPGTTRNSALRLRRGVDVGNGDWLFAMPIWPLFVTAVLVSAVPWCHFTHRFSLRTLLIMTSLVAFALGLFVWLASPA